MQHQHSPSNHSAAAGAPHLSKLALPIGRQRVVPALKVQVAPMDAAHKMDLGGHVHHPPRAARLRRQ